MRLCYGTFAKVLVLCALNGKTQLDIHDALMMTLDPDDRLELSRDGPQASRWINCDTNLNRALINAIPYATPEEVAKEFSDVVMELFDPNRIRTAALAIRSIIRMDDSILPETVVDIVGNVSKGGLEKAPLSESADFFAGILLYAVSVPANKAGRDYIHLINDAFLADAALGNAENPPHVDYAPIVSWPTDAIAEPPRSTEEYAILPIYLVLDTSFSMQIGNRFNIAFGFLPRLLSAMMSGAALSDKVRVGVILFDEDARLDMPLGDIRELEAWVGRRKKNPITPNGNNTFYGNMFKLLRSEIIEGVRKIHSMKMGSGSFVAYRPVVFFITDGAPSDDSVVRSAAFAELTDRNFEYRPNMVCVGIGEVDFKDLVQYGAGRYKSSSGSYITCNENMVIVPRGKVSPSDALSSIIPSLVASIVNSINSDTHTHYSGGIRDLFGSQDVLFDAFDWGED